MGVAQPESERGRVLLVDDEPAILRAFSRHLTLAGFTVVTAHDGGEATERLAEATFDVVLTDISMPTLGGLELLQSIRQRDADLPVLLMTGSPSITTASQAIPFGVLAYLTKPVAPSEMLALVHRAVHLHRLAKVKREALEYLNHKAADWIGDRTALNASLSAALDTAWMAYQPIVSLVDRRIVAFEALVRPSHPAFPSPDVFIRAAEQLGRVHEMGRRLRDMVAVQMAQPGNAPDVFVNIHGQDLTDDLLLSADAPLAAVAARVVLEITERSSLDNLPDLEARVKRLRVLGFRIAIDDLGAGYSGLTLLARLQPEIVKIDMSLVRDIEKDQVKQRLVQSMLTLCSQSSMKVVCEGVETEAERDTLSGMGADWLQGYFFARPGRAFPTVIF